MSSIAERLAVCSWSLQPKSPEELIQQLNRIGLHRVQIALDPIREQPALWGKLGQGGFRELTCVSGMFGCVGEDYTTMETIRRTGGIVPDQTWEQNWRNIQETASLAQRMNLSVVSFHAGFLPHEPSDPNFQKLLQRLRQVADVFAKHKIDLALETGQESADTLKSFLHQLDRRNVGVNFDPANMILYDKGDPIEALQILGPWLQQVHIKDARRTRVPGTWGDEVVVGTGQVDWRAFFQMLNRLNFRGYLCIEREAGQQRVPDIRTAREFVQSLAV